MMRTLDFDTRAWVIWVLSAATVTMTARNPMYSLLLLLVSRVVSWSHVRQDAAVRLELDRVSAIRMGVLILLFSGMFTALFVHAGETILLVIPEAIPLIGGVISLEAFLNGASNGLLLLTLLSFFLAFNSIVPADRLARLAPRAFQDLGIVVLVALTYIPETVQHVRRIREAQAVRGHRIEGIRDWRPLLIPLLVGGLERAMGLAEAMVARGFGATARAPVSARMVGGLALAMGLTFGGWIVALWWAWPGWTMMGVGLALMAGIVWAAGRHTVTTQYRRRAWQAQDTLLVAASIAPAMIIALPWEVIDRSALTVNFLNGLRWPPFDPRTGIFILLYVLPAYTLLSGAEPVGKDHHDYH